MNALKQLKIGLLAVMLLIIVGTIGFRYIEEWSYLDSLYMTIITMATVGYREISPLSQAGKIFTIALIVVGVTLVFWVVTSLVEVAVGEQLWHAFARRKMEERIAEISEHYIICGFGRMGQQIAQDFARHKIPFVVIEINPEQIPKLIASNTPFVEGNASEDTTLIAAGIKRARGLVTVAPTDADNIFITLSARVLNPRLYIVARSIQEDNEDKIRRAGADRVMSPYVLGGRRMASAVLHPHVTDFLETTLNAEDLEIQMQGVKMGKDSQFVDRSLKDSALRQVTGATILAVKRVDGQLIANPAPDTILHDEDMAIALGTEKQLATLRRLAEG